MSNVKHGVRRRHLGVISGRSTHSPGTYSPDQSDSAGEVYDRAGMEQVTKQDISPGAVDIGAFAAGLAPIGIVATLPALPSPSYPIGSLVVLTSDGKLYRNVADAWSKAVDGVDLIADSVTAGAIAAGAIGTSELHATATIALVSNAGATVVINAAGITIEDGALIFRDEFGSTILDGAGFGAAWSRFVTSGVYNSDFFAQPPTPANDLNDTTNVMPFWPFDTVSGSAVTAKNVADSGTGSGRVLRFSLAAGAAGDNAYVKQVVPVNGSRGRFYTYVFSGAFRATAGGLPEVYISAQYLKEDLSAIAAAQSENRTLTEINGRPDNILRAKVGVELGTAPAEAHFAEVRIGFKRAAAANGTTASVDILEFITDRYSTDGLWLTDYIDPSIAPSLIQQQSGKIIAGATNDMSLTAYNGPIVMNTDSEIVLHQAGASGTLQVYGRDAWIPSRVEGFTLENVAASGTDVPFGRFVATQTTNYIARPLAGRAGRVVAIAWRKSAAITGGTMVIELVVGTATGVTVTLDSGSGNTGVFVLSSPVSFSSGTGLGFEYTTDGSYAPATIDYGVEMIVEYEALV